MNEANRDEYQSYDFRVRANSPWLQKQDTFAVLAAADTVLEDGQIEAEQLLVEMARNRRPLDWSDVTEAVDSLSQELQDILVLLSSVLYYKEQPHSFEAVAARKAARLIHELHDYFNGGYDHE